MPVKLRGATSCSITEGHSSVRKTDAATHRPTSRPGGTRPPPSASHGFRGRTQKQTPRDTRETGSCRGGSSIALALPSTHLQFFRWSCIISEVQSRTPSAHHEVSADLSLSVITITHVDPKVNTWSGRRHQTQQEMLDGDFMSMHKHDPYTFLLFFSFFSSPDPRVLQGGGCSHMALFSIPLHRKCIIVHCGGTVVFF